MGVGCGCDHGGAGYATALEGRPSRSRRGYNNANVSRSTRRAILRCSEAPEIAREYPLYLDAPFAEKDEAKAPGAKWDGGSKEEFAPGGNLRAAGRGFFLGGAWNHDKHSGHLPWGLLRAG